MSLKQLRAYVSDDPAVVLVAIDSLYQLGDLLLGWL